MTPICAVVLVLALSCSAILLKPSPMPLAVHRAENLALGHGYSAQPGKALAFFNAILRDDAKSLDTYIKQADSCLQESGRMEGVVEWVLRDEYEPGTQTPYRIARLLGILHCERGDIPLRPWMNLAPHIVSYQRAQIPHLWLQYVYSELGQPERAAYSASTFRNFNPAFKAKTPDEKKVGRSHLPYTQVSDSPSN